MRKVVLLVLCAMLICPTVHGETASIPQGTRDSFYGRFLASYCLESNTYWIMIKVTPSFMGISLPFGYRYQVYSISDDMKSTQFAFSSQRAIYSILPTKKYVFYELEILFDSTSSELWCYDIESGIKSRVIDHPIQSLVAYSNNSIVYLDQKRNLCSFSLISEEERIIAECEYLISSDNDSIYYSVSDGSIFAYSLHSGVCSPYDVADGIDVHTIGYGYIVDKRRDALYSSYGDIWNIDNMHSASSLGLDDDYLCAFYPANSPSEKGRLVYALLESPDQVASIEIEASLDRNVNIVNGSVLFYSEQAKRISVVSLASGERSYIELP